MDARWAALGAAWGITGVVGLLAFAVARLAPVAAEALAGPLDPVHWVAVAASLAFFGYTEGYRAFQRQFSPRVVARAFALLHRGTPLSVLLAPLFCMGFFGATRKRMIVSWSLTGGIVLLIAAVRALPQPWRGIVDLGVVFALVWGAVAILAFAARAALGEGPRVPADLPEPA